MVSYDDPNGKWGWSQRYITWTLMLSYDDPNGKLTYVDLNGILREP
jgi:hypothetical protein